jgi:HK97 gp10 family phage protein
MSDDAALQGVSALIQKLKDLSLLDDGKALRAAVRAGMKPALKSAQERAPQSARSHKVYTGEKVEPGFLKANLRVVTTLSADKQQAVALLGPRKKAYYGTQFVEIGTSRAPAHPWLRPAFYAKQEEEKTALADSLRAYLAKRAAQP